MEQSWEPNLKTLGQVYLGTFFAGAELTGAKIRALLVAMMLQTNRTVSLERITEALWDDEPPRSAVANIRSLACQLRGRLPEVARLESRIGGYELVVPERECDHLRFRSLADTGRAALRGGDPARAVEALAMALAQWHGDRAAVGVARIGPLAVWLAQLDEERERVMEDQAEAYLTLGEARPALRLLKALLGAAPTRSRGWSLCLRAYHLIGDQDLVADTYRQACTAFRRRLGVPPDDGLQRLYLKLMGGSAVTRRPSHPWAHTADQK